MKLKRLIKLGATFFVLTASALAQFTLRGNVNGVVTDQSQAVIPNIEVSLEDLDRRQTSRARTNDDGLYSFTSLTPGRYQVSVEHTGFRKAISDVITVGSQQTIRVDLPLSVGGITDTVEVAATSPLLQTEHSVAGTVVDRHYLANLPSKGRNFTSAVTLVPGISTAPRRNTGSTFSVGGHAQFGGVEYRPGGGGDVGFYINGANTNDNFVGGMSYVPSIDAVNEVKVDVANFSAANGRDISTLNTTIRGGTSSFHGSAFESLQNSVFNAWNPVDKRNVLPGTKKPTFQRNHFGGTFGGPLIIPKLFNKRDKLFFFTSLELTRERAGNRPSIHRVPTEAERQGDFSELLRRFPGNPSYVLYNPFSTIIDPNGNSIRTPIPNNDLRLARRPDGSPLINSEAQKFVSELFPLPNGYRNPTNPNDLSNYFTTRGRGKDVYRFDNRIDYRISQNDNVYVHYSRYEGAPLIRGGLIPELTSDYYDNSYLLTANYARTFSPTLTNEFIFGFGSGYLDSLPPEVRTYQQRDDTPFARYVRNRGEGDDLGVYNFQIGGFTGAPGIGNFVEAFKNPTLQFSDNLTWVKGNHTFKTGFNYFLKKEKDYYYNRDIVFDGHFTNSGSAAGSRGGLGLADLLAGIPTSLGQRYDFQGGEPDLQFTFTYWGGYAEDVWKVNPKMTISAGLRYDLSIPIYSENSYGLAQMDFTYPGWQLAIPGRAEGLPQKANPADKNNFAPRISVAYSLKPDFVVRASYGVFYSVGLSAYGNDLIDNGFGSVPGYVGSTIDNSFFGVNDDIPRLTFGDILPAPLSFETGQFPVSTGTGTGWYDFRFSGRLQDKDSFTAPYYHRYMVELQKEIGPKMVLSVNYIGGDGNKLPYFENFNKPSTYRTGYTSTAQTDAARPNNTGRFRDIFIRRPGLTSNYNAATIRLQRRLSEGLQFETHYTFSKTVGTEGYAYTNFQYNRHLARGEWQFSHPHRYVLALVYEPTWTRSLSTIPKALLGGWAFGVIANFESGDALTIGNGQTSARDLEPNRPNLNTNPNLARGERTFERYFNTNAFSAPPQDVKGTAGQGIVRGPGQNNWDLSLSRNFSPWESLRMEFRAELYNAFNHPQWLTVDTTFGNQNPNFGRVTSARDGRVAQFNLRFVF